MRCRAVKPIPVIGRFLVPPRMVRRAAFNGGRYILLVVLWGIMVHY